MLAEGRASIPQRVEPLLDGLPGGVLVRQKEIGRAGDVERRTDYGHSPPLRGPDGARDDYENAVKQVGAVIRYQIDALVTDGDTVAAAWTGTLPGGPQIGKGLCLYQTGGGLLRATRHALIAPTPS